jgi:GNAT superfamily N-acetyltransferase
MWRPARPEDDDVIVQLCLALHAEVSRPLASEQMKRTLVSYRRDPWRGRAVALELKGAVRGYALLAASRSSEVGGEVCQVDELYVAPPVRGQGHGVALFTAIERAEVWPAPPVAIALGATAAGSRERGVYERLGFQAAGATLIRRGPGKH